MDHRFLEASLDWVTLISLDGKLTYLNENGCRHLEVSDPAVLRGSDWSAVWPSECRERTSLALAAAASGDVTRYSAFCPTHKGTPKWWDVVVSPVRDAGGLVEQILAVARDVTRVKAVEQTLKESEQRFRALADTIPQLAWMADPSGSVYWYNQRWFDYTGKSMDEMRGMGWTSVHHPDHVERVVEKFKDCLARGEEWEDLFPLRGTDGTYRWFLSRALPQKNADGVPVLYCGTNTDITDQRNQSQRLRQLARIVDLSHEAILVWDLEQGIVSWNRGCVELYGYAKTDAIGAISHDLLQTRLPVPPAEFERLLVVEGSWSGELLHRAADGSEVWVESRQELMRVGGRRLVLETNRDITERRQADETRNLLVAELNHRVKNTLAIVQSLATQTARTARSLPQLVTSFNGRLHALATGHTILTECDWVGASIDELVRAQLAMFGDFTDRISISGEDVFLPPQTALQLTLILHELGTNALKHGALSNLAGRVAIDWSLSESMGAAAPTLELQWRERGGPPTKAPSSQTGFGLALIERTSRMPNFDAKLDFAPEGITACVTAILPTPAEHAKPALFNPGKRLLRRRSPALASASARIVRERILIVEREPSDAMRLEDMLYDAGYTTLGPVATPAEVDQKLERLGVELVIVDADGLRTDVETVMRAISERKLPCILIGSVRWLSQLPEHTSEIPRLTKPLEPQLLMSTIATTIASSRKPAT
ncbi:MAG: PAS domain S-box protein [Hyphomicrobiaceae bacterium]|nr:PAS domain S-box protein [Hyphomicrobiaceae bacterium]